MATLATFGMLAAYKALEYISSRLNLSIQISVVWFQSAQPLCITLGPSAITASVMLAAAAITDSYRRPRGITGPYVSINVTDPVK